MDGVEILTSGFGPRGPLGPSGPSGPAGPRGIFGGNGFAFTFSTNTADTDPGPGVVKFNSATYGAVSEIFIDLEDSEGTDITSWVNSLADANNIPAAVIKIFSQVNPTRWATFTLISVTSAVGYRKLAVVPVASSSAFTTIVGDTNLVFAPAGNQGNVGPMGPTGPAGGPIGAANDIVYLLSSGVSTVDTGHFMWNPTDKGLDIYHPTQIGSGNAKGRISFYNRNGNNVRVEYGRIQSFDYDDNASALILYATGLNGAVHEGLRVKGSYTFTNNGVGVSYVGVGGVDPEAALHVLSSVNSANANVLIVDNTGASFNSIGAGIKFRGTGASSQPNRDTGRIYSYTNGDPYSAGHIILQIPTAADTWTDIVTVTISGIKDAVCYQSTSSTTANAATFTNPNLGGSVGVGIKFRSPNASNGFFASGRIYSNFAIDAYATARLVLQTPTAEDTWTDALVATNGVVQIAPGASGAGNLAQSFIGDTDTGYYRSAANEIRWQTGGVDAVTVDASQRMIVSISGTNYAGVTITTSTSGGGLVLGNTNANAATRNWAVVGNWLDYGDFAILQGETLGANPLGGSPSNGVAKIYISAVGLVGINATAPGAQLQVTSSAAGTIGQIIKLAATPTAHALDINSSLGSGGDLAYINQYGSAYLNSATGNTDPVNSNPAAVLRIPDVGTPYTYTSLDFVGWNSLSRISMQGSYDGGTAYGEFLFLTSYGIGPVLQPAMQISKRRVRIGAITAGVGNATAPPSATLDVAVPDASTIGQIIKLAATPTAHALDINSSLGSGGDLAYIDQTGTISSTGGQSASERFGASSSVTGTYATAIGLLAIAAGSSTAVGAVSEASGGSAVSLGYNSSAKSSASTAIGTGASAGANGGSTYAIAIGAGAVANERLAIAIGGGASATPFASMAIGNCTATAANQIVIGNEAAGYGITDIYLGSGVTNTSPTSITLNTTGSSGTNIAGAFLNLAGGKGTGNAAGGAIRFLASTAGSTGTTLQTLAEKMRVDPSGVLIGSGTPIVKVLSATATLDFGNTTAQTSADLTITVTGAAVGDNVIVTPPASPDANTSFTGWVSAADTVKVRFNNYSSASVDPASGTYRATVVKF